MTTLLAALTTSSVWSQLFILWQLPSPIAHPQLLCNEEEYVLGCIIKNESGHYGISGNKGIGYETGGNARGIAGYQGVCCL